jgi:hypothetical protein
MGECHLQHNDLYLAKDYFLRASVYYNELGKKYKIYSFENKKLSFKKKQLFSTLL